MGWIRKVRGWIRELRGWIRKMLRRWESANRHRRLTRDLVAFHARCRVDGDPVLEDLIGLSFTAWEEGWGVEGLNALYQVAREFRRKAS